MAKCKQVQTKFPRCIDVHGLTLLVDLRNIVKDLDLFSNTSALKYINIVCPQAYELLGNMLS
jgi:hypothetical protein